MQQHGHGGGTGGGHGASLLKALATAGARWSPPEPDDVLLAIDDTDNLESPGTGFRARELALLLSQAGLALPVAITRHQLLVDPRVPYTSHNSSACLVLKGVSDPAAVFALACEYLSANAAEGADVGVVLRRRDAVPPSVLDWGHRAKREVLLLDDARALCRTLQARSAELSGTGGGRIGALAAVGLNAAGNDGRLLWLRGIRESAGKFLTAFELTESTAVRIETPEGLRISDPETLINVGDWPRAVYRDHNPVFLVEPSDEPSSPPWRSIPRELVKQLSS